MFPNNFLQHLKYLYRIYTPKLNGKRLCRHMINLIDNWHFHQLYRKYFKVLNIFSQKKKSLYGNLIIVNHFNVFSSFVVKIYNVSTMAKKILETCNDSQYFRLKYCDYQPVFSCFFCTFVYSLIASEALPARHCEVQPTNCCSLFTKAQQTDLLWQVSKQSLRQHSFFLSLYLWKQQQGVNYGVRPPPII